AATDVGLLPATVVSRCQVVKLGLVPADEIAAGLIGAKDVDAVKAEVIGHLSAGRPGRAFELAEDDKALAEAREALGEIAGLDARGSVERLKSAERVAQAHAKAPAGTE